MSLDKIKVPAKAIEASILFIRGEKVMLDSDLAVLYGVETKVLIQAVKRNIERFPDDFMFQLSRSEYEGLRSQIVTLKKSRGQHRKYLPYAFTEQGVAMLSAVLKSKRAIQVNIEIMRTFVRIRKMIESHSELAKKLYVVGMLFHRSLRAKCGNLNHLSFRTLAYCHSRLELESIPASDFWLLILRTF